MVSRLHPIDEVRWNHAKTTVQNWMLASGLSPEELSANEVSGYHSSFLIFGWRLRIEYDAETVLDLDLLLPKDFPWSVPKIVLVNRPEFRTWPHVEENGVLCLIPSSATLSVNDPITMTKVALSKAIELIDRVKTQDSARDFKSEFHSYWPKDENVFSVKSLINFDGSNRIVSANLRKKLCFVADNDQVIQEWLANILVSKQTKVRNLSKGILINLPEPLLPEQYPKNINDLINILGTEISLLHQIIENMPLNIPVILTAPADTGRTVCAVIIEANFKVEGRESIFRGFRKEAMPADHLYDRYLKSAKIKRTKVERVDPNWVHGRDSNLTVNDLQKYRVGIIGCGSLGGYVAYNLAQSGIGELHLIDPDILTHANTGRHILGAKYASTYKAESLAAMIKESFPHIMLVKHDNKFWQEVVSETPEALEEMDLIISTIAEWAPESSLNAYSLSQPLASPILYGWTEPHAVAGHALLICGDAGCFSCNMSDYGNYEERVSDWPAGSGMRAEPGCGAFFQPYGPIELSHTVNLICEVALDYLTEDLQTTTHRIWATKKHTLTRSGGVWSPFWGANPDWSTGGIEVNRQWPKIPTCKVCG